MNQTIESTVYQSPERASAMSFTFPPGSSPLPPYTIRRGIGIGGFGEVYFAVSQAGKEVALKRIQRNLEIELRGVSQCLNLKHPNLISLFDICQDSEKRSWVVMEYVAGDNMRQSLDDHPNGLAPSEVDRWLRGIAGGVSHLHSAGLVHRDLKPGNIFDDQGVVKIGDYGLCKFISSSQRGGQTESVGTFHYMAPEIGKGQYGREIDIYAMGVILHEMITGSVPFDGESCHEIIVKHLTAVPDLSQVPQPYRDVIARSLEKDPAKRPSSVAEFMASLNLDDEVIQLSSATVIEPNPAAPASTPNLETEHHSASGFHAKAANAEVESKTAPQEAPVVEPGSSPSQEEPVMRAIRTCSKEFSGWWRSMDQRPGLQAVVAIVIGVVLMMHTGWLLPLLIMLGVIYVPYYVVRAIVLQTTQQPSYAQASQLAAQTAASRVLSPAQLQQEVRHAMRAKHPVVRAAELSTSWVASLLTVAAMTTGLAVIGLREKTVELTDIAYYAGIGVISLVSAAVLLAAGKLWERDEGEALTRRLVLAGLGAMVGLVAYGACEAFMLPMVADQDSWLGNARPVALYETDGTMKPAGMMAHFALLFFLVRWWRPADPLRKSRLSLWSVAVICVFAWLTQQIFPVPQPAGFLIAGMLAVTVQMSAPWIRPADYSDAIAGKRNPSKNIAQEA
ncbi:MAG: hypothetical protein CBB71_19420 [Rhodopirellula sp. TMED11]|nr:MAG: hypothetical protein CBB71_19420 [Rhodopirellula sp. TMED11]